MLEFYNIGPSKKPIYYLTGDVYKVSDGIGDVYRVFDGKDRIGFFVREKHEDIYRFVLTAYGWAATVDDLRTIADKLDELNIRGGLLGEGGER